MTTTDQDRQAATAASQDWAWLSAMSADGLSKLSTSQRGDDADLMRGRYMRAKHSRKAVRDAGVRLYADPGSRT